MGPHRIRHRHRDRHGYLHPDRSASQEQRRPRDRHLVPDRRRRRRARGDLLRRARRRCADRGSSYTYAYTTIGEVFAWIIAWDLILEFALGAAVVARGWSGYLQHALGLPHAFFGEKDSVVNLGAVLIVVVIGTIATIGIRESS
ncbi:amino acid permease [Aeromicrobium sp. UC242_57]|uniref:amino acid permease n=1 Tax=Aeromicrobium sp. UC242_57 TaxID=3374624 RepID=UPI0037B2C04A